MCEISQAPAGDAGYPKHLYRHHQLIPGSFSELPRYDAIPLSTDRPAHSHHALTDTAGLHSLRPVQHLLRCCDSRVGVRTLGEDHCKRGEPMHLAAEMTQFHCTERFLRVRLRGSQVAKLAKRLRVLKL